ncbi:substrate-binding domain-containing protein [Paenibacillus sp. CGMCC 1.16610]|uniref:Substrate-binding domain-containing protein n=1 Tax=Paenibacillus anseongense TaxID=2682845 RepID=A0ABW9UJZ7_9BACL|nr:MULTISPECIES: substrate-binding domain-containing protein [Paenibacillus]MBA2943495.1 substrate-binding domain-containing protein [Paenibacillus sp. CGMCC 1.16610]MVQ39646.1 substrate-binding domain-containing protein [Paenibacillus anseongense]
MDKTMKLGPLIFAILAAAFSMSSCMRNTETESTPTEKKKHLEVVLRSQNGDYWKTVKMGAEVAAKEFNVTLDFRAPDDEGDVKGQIALMEQSVNSGPDAIVLAANDYKELSGVVDDAEGRGIPVVAIDSEVESRKARSFIGANNYEAGQMAGQQLIKLVGPKGNIAIVSFKQGERNTELREQGLLDEISKYPTMKVIAKVYTMTDRGTADQLTQGIIEKYPHLDGIVALNEISSIGVADAIQRMNLQDKVKIITFDSTSEELELLQEGVIQATIIQNPFSIGYLGVKNAVEASHGKKIPGRVDTGIKAIDLNNMFWSDNQKLLFPFIK